MKEKQNKFQYLPTTIDEFKERQWSQADVILISGDTYIDVPSSGISVIGRVLESRGFKVAIIAQPDLSGDDDITRLGEPRLFWGVSGGLVDSMVANYTASKKKRKQDDMTPGEQNYLRPNRAVIAYANAIRKNFKNTVPIVLGGIEASLRRLAHYDFWDNSIRRSVVFDSKADYIVYGMAEKAVLDLAIALDTERDPNDIRGLCYISHEKKNDFIDLPPYEDCLDNKNSFIEMFDLLNKNMDPLTAKGLSQKHGNRYLIQNPPQLNVSEKELDQVYSLPYTYNAHPYYAQKGKIRALDTVRFSVTTHRGCYGDCNFCSIAIHQGRTIVSRSEKSIINEIDTYKQHKDFKGIISNMGGATANMYSMDCKKKIEKGMCENKKCLFPETCSSLEIDHRRQIDLLKKVQSIEGVRKVFIASGIRYDLINEDEKYGNLYLKYIMKNNISGQMKIAPEHTGDRLLKLMGKPSSNALIKFINSFETIKKQTNDKLFLTYYFIAAHPGCSEDDMVSLKNFISTKLSITPEQVQIFIPLPSTWSAVMYYTEMDPFSGKKIFVEKDYNRRIKQKEIITGKKKKIRNKR